MAELKFNMNLGKIGNLADLQITSLGEEHIHNRW